MDPDIREIVSPQEQADIGSRAAEAYRGAAFGDRDPAEVARWLAPAETDYPACEAAALRLKAYSIAGDACGGMLSPAEAGLADRAYHMAMGRSDALGSLGMVEFALERAALPEVGFVAKAAAASASFASLGLVWARQGCPDGATRDWLVWFARDALASAGDPAPNLAVMMLASLSRSVSEAGLRSREGWPETKKALALACWDAIEALDPLDEAAAIKAYLLECSESGLESVLA